MDSYLIDYLKSGKAWLLVGSGPSNEMGYPSWQDLAVSAFTAVKASAPGQDHKRINQALHSKDFPSVFEKAQKVLGWPGLLQVLQREFKPKGTSEIYKLITRWPAAVYLTTNYDNEIQSHLVEHKETYIPYNNTEDHLGYLLPELQGAIVKLHGDLRSEQGLILTSSQYKDISEGPQWEYWRNKMTSIFQMNRVIVVGHSLRDPNIQHVLEAAKKGGGVTQPICWIAPDVTREERKEYLEKYRIRVLAYDNRDGSHINLLRLIQNISEFIPPRTSVSIREQIKMISYSPLGESGAAPGFFVFNKLAAQSEYEEKRVDIILAAIQAVIATLSKLGTFSMEKAFDLAGWPSKMLIPPNFLQEVKDKAIQSGLLVETSIGLTVGQNAETIAAQSKNQFDHLRNRYKQQLKLRLKGKFPSLSDAETSLIATDIEASLAGYFREGGLSLSSTLFSSYHAKSNLVPSSIIDFINEASAKYDGLLMRQAFSTVSVDSFLHATPAERDFLGRISQGFFAFHALGVFGEVAIERFKKAKESIWLVDSNIQIPALAFAAPTNPVFVDCFSRLRDAGIRLFST